MFRLSPKALIEEHEAYIYATLTPFPVRAAALLQALNKMIGPPHSGALHSQLDRQPPNPLPVTPGRPPPASPQCCICNSGPLVTHLPVWSHSACLADDPCAETLLGHM